jgi:hypothetical protein
LGDFLQQPRQMGFGLVRTDGAHAD